MLSRLSSPFKLLPYQEQALQAIEERLAEHQSTLLVLPTGGGKTVVFSTLTQKWLAERRARRVLVIAHRGELLTQATRMLEAFGMVVEREQAQSRARVRSFFNSHAVVATVQTMKGRRLERWPRDAFDLVIVDEGHHATAKTYRQILAHFGAPTLFVTATPDRGDGVGLRNVCDSVAYSYTIADAIRDGYLVRPEPIDCQLPELDISQVRTTAGDLNEADLGAAMEVHGAVARMASAIVELSEGRTTVVFLPLVDTAKHMAEMMSPLVGADRVEVVHGKTPSEDRQRIMADFAQGKVKFLCNVGVLTEGWDAPNVQCVAIARPTKSRALYTQMVGRGLRPMRDETGQIRMDLKPSCRILHFEIRTGDHSLCSPVDALAGSMDEETLELVKKDKRLTDALMRGDLEAVQHEAREQARQRELRDRARRVLQRFSTDAIYTAAMGPVQAMLGQGMGESVLDDLRNLGMRAQDIARLRDREHAEAKREELLLDRRKGMASYRQKEVLRRSGLRTDLTRKKASEAIDILVKNGWRPTKELRDRYGVTKDPKGSQQAPQPLRR